MWLRRDLAHLSCLFTVGLLLVVSCTEESVITKRSDEESLMCSGTGMLMFQGDGRFSVVLENSEITPGDKAGSLMCEGEVSVMANSTLYARIISKGRFKCNSSNNVRICGYGDTKLIRSDGSSSLLQCNGEPLIPATGNVTFNSTETLCLGNGTFTVQGFGKFTLVADAITCTGDTIINMPTLYSTDGDFVCSGNGPYTISGYGQLFSVSSETGNCTNGLFPIVKYCTGSGGYLLCGEGTYSITTQSENISCFGNVTLHGLYFTTLGPFCCQGHNTFALSGSGILYATNVTDYDNCSSLIDSEISVGYDSNIFTSCIGTGANAFSGNGYFYIAIHATSSDDGLKCVGNVNSTHMSNGILYGYSYGQFRCIASGDLLINGTGVIEDDDILCSANPIDHGETLQCSGTGEFKIIGSGVFEIVAIPEITCIGNGEHSIFDVGERFMSKGSFTCNGSEYFTLNGTGIIESVTTIVGVHNCTDMITITSGSGIIDVVTCSGEGDYIVVGDGEFYINQTGPGMLHCHGEVMSGVNVSHRAEYFINGEFSCMVSGVVYFTGIGRAEVTNASASYECNGVFFPGPTVEPPFSGFGGEEIACIAYGEYIIVGSGHIQVIAQPSTPLGCQGSISSDLDHNVVTSNGDFMCTGNDFVWIFGRGEVFVNSTGFNNCTNHHTTISNKPLLCSGFGEYEIFGSANATIFGSDEIVCHGEVFPFSSDGQGSFYYAGGNYRCTVNGLFNITGVGDAMIVSTTNDTGANNYSCYEFHDQSFSCRTFAFNSSTNEDGNNSNIFTSCIGTGANTFCGNGYFYIAIRAASSDDILNCVGNVTESYVSNGTIYTYSYGQFSCIGSGDLSINGTGIVEDDDIFCSANSTDDGKPLQCSGTGEFEIVGSGFFEIVAIPEITCIGTGEHSMFDVGERFMSKGSFTCNGSEYFTLNGTGIIESVTTNIGGVHNCTDMITITSGSGMIDVVTCSGEGDYIVVGDGEFYINRTGPGMLHCHGEVISGVNVSHRAEYFIYGKFSCKVSGVVYFAGMGSAEVTNASASYECNGVFFPGPTVEPPFSGFGGEEIACIAYGEYIIVGSGHIQVIAQPSTPLGCQGSISSDLDHNVVTSNGDFMCTGNDFVWIFGRGEVFVNSTGFNNCTNRHTTISNKPLLCSGFGEYEILGSANATIFGSDEIVCHGEVFPFSSDGQGSFYYAGGNYRCTVNGLFNITGVGDAMIVSTTNDTGANNHSCYEFHDQSFSCRTFAFNSSTDEDGDNSNIFTSCIGTGANTFCGNGYFYIAIRPTSSDDIPYCVGNVTESYVSNGTLCTHSYGQFSCIGSGDLSINGTGIVEDDDIFCSANSTDNGEPLQCSGTGEFEIVGSGFFEIVAIPEITCIGTGEHSIFDVGERFMSKGSFTCNGSEYFTLNGTGIIESVTTNIGSVHNCTDMIAITSGSGMIDVVTCSGEGDYIVVGDGEFYINQTGPGMLHCHGEVMSGVNVSHRAEYFINGEFSCMVSGVVYFTGIGRAEVTNASASYECNGVFFPGPTVEPPFSGFGGEEIACIAYGEYIIVGSGHIQVIAQPSTPLGCQGSISSDLDHNVVTSNGDFMCTGNDFVWIFGRGEVFVNSTGFNNCTNRHTTISNNPLLCSGFGEYEIFGSANATIFGSDEIVCHGEVFPFSSDGQGSFYYAGGNYACTVNGLFNITGVGDAMIVSTTNDTGANNYSCFEYHDQSLSCATFTFNSSTDEDVMLMGIGEFTIIGDKYLYCTGNAVLCPGEINYYFTDGHFYCSSDVFVYINGIGSIENISGVNNCSGFGFGAAPIISGAPLSHQPSCIGFSDEYQIIGNGTFNTSRLLGELDCNVTFQEPDSDLHIFSSFEESFSCTGNGIFAFEGTGDAAIILDKGYFDCVDLSTSTPSKLITSCTYMYISKIYISYQYQIAMFNFKPVMPILTCCFLHAHTLE